MHAVAPRHHAGGHAGGTKTRKLTRIQKISVERSTKEDENVEDGAASGSF